MLTLHSIVFDTYEDGPELAMPVLDVFTRNGASHDIIQTVATTGAIKSIQATKAVADEIEAATFINSVIARVGLRGTVLTNTFSYDNATLMPFSYRITHVGGPKDVLIYFTLPVKVVGAVP